MATVKKKTTLPKAVRQRVFLKVYAQCGNLTQAAMGAQVDVSVHYKWLNEPEYQQEFSKAHETALDLLEAEARRRAVEGDDEPVIYQGGLCYERLVNGRKKQIVLKRRSDNLLMFLLKAGRPEKFRDQWKGEIRHSGAISKGPDLSALTNEQLEQLETLFRLSSGSSDPVAGIADGSACREGETPEE